jgi:hypothetical protein
MEMEHHVSHEALRSTILSGAAGIDIPSLRAFLEILSENDSEYDSDDIDYHAPPHMCYHINNEVLPKEASELMPLDQSPYSHATFLQEKADRLQSR